MSSIKAADSGEVTILRRVTGSPAVTAEPESVIHAFQFRDEVDRRHYDRRVTGMHLLEELRSHVWRRHNNQRRQDIKTVIDEMA